MSTFLVGAAMERMFSFSASDKKIKKLFVRQSLTKCRVLDSSASSCHSFSENIDFGLGGECCCASCSSSWHLWDELWSSETNLKKISLHYIKK